MKEDSFKFAIEDFLAYLFPGIIMILAIAAFLSLSPFRYILANISFNLVTGLILIACAYSVGVSISSLTGLYDRYIEKVFNITNPINSIQLEGFEEAVMKAFNDIFGDHGAWSGNHFYLARALIREKMPNCAAAIERENSLRQMRQNSLLPVLFLGVAGILAGAKNVLNSGDKTSVVWGIALILIAILISYLVINTLVVHGVYGNRRREVREVCSGLLAYYHLKT